MKTPIELITEERQRQQEKEGWTHEHDDAHTGMSLSTAAASYALNCASEHTDWNQDWIDIYKEYSATVWPFDEQWFKPTPDDPIRQLTKAGALIVAEMERLQRAKSKPNSQA